MFVDIYKNGKSDYIRLSTSKRIVDKETGKASIKKISINIGPVSRFDDGKPNFIQRLKDSFKAGMPIIPELQPYVVKKQQNEKYQVEFHKGNKECIAHPKLCSNILFDKILEELGIYRYITLYKNIDGISYDVLGFIKLLLYGRILNPASKIQTTNQNDDYYIPILNPNFYKYNIYDTLDFIEKHRKSFFNIIDKNMRKKFGRTTNIIYYDVTNFFFHIDHGDYIFDAEGNKIYTGLRQKGVSKEERSLPIVQMGLLMDEFGFPISIECFKGNTLDHQTLQKSFNNSVKSLENTRFIFVSDKGIGCGDNMKYTISNGNGYIISKSVRACTKEERKWILSDDDYTYQSDTFKIKSRIYTKTFKLENGTTLKKSEKIVTYWSKKFYDRSYNELKEYYDFVKKLIESPESFRITKIHRHLNKYMKKEFLHTRTGEMIESKDLIASLDLDKLKEDFELLGFYSIVTSETNLSDQEIIDTYHNLTAIEDQFRVMKSSLDARPVYVRTEEHIIAHFVICTFALLFLRIIQYKTNTNGQKLSIDRIIKALSMFKIQLLPDDYYMFNDTNEKDLENILAAFELKIPYQLFKKSEINELKKNIKIST